MHDKDLGRTHNKPGIIIITKILSAELESLDVPTLHSVFRALESKQV